MEGTRLHYLLRRYADRQLTQPEEEELQAVLETTWADAAVGVPSPVDWTGMLATIVDDHADAASEIKAAPEAVGPPAHVPADGDQAEVPVRQLRPVRRMLPVRRIRPVWRMRPVWRWVGVAAAVIVVVVGGWWWVRERRVPEVASVGTHDVLPGGSKAILTLSGGQQILLDSAATGELAQQGASRVTKTGNGALVYRAGEVAGAATLYNTLSTPRGGQYQLTLPDGTKVWLNAASSITYPTAFTGTERKVEITGEAYLEVAKDAARPFSVIAAGSTVQVLGTSFNINAYKDEPVRRITLISGRIAVEKMLLAPGQQALAEGQRLTKHPHPDLEAVMAWKNGLFQFDRTDLRATMRQLARWYDVEVVYEGNVPDIKFWGTIHRDLKLSELLHFLQRSDVHFIIEGKKLIVRP